MRGRRKPWGAHLLCRQSRLRPQVQLQPQPQRQGHYPTAPAWLAEPRCELHASLRGSLVSQAGGGRQVSGGTCYDRVAQLHQGLSQSPAVGHHLALIDSELWRHGLLQGHSNTWQEETMGPEGRMGSKDRLGVRKQPLPPLRLPRFSVSPKQVDHIPPPQMTYIFNPTITWLNCQTSSV